MYSIEVNELSKIYENHNKEAGMKAAVKGFVKREEFENTAVNKISFTVNEGEIVGLLGANGSGKTTTMKMLTGILNPTSGEAKVMGYVPWKRSNEYRKKISLIMGQKSQLWWDLPAIDTFCLNKIIYGLDEKEYQKNLSELVDVLDAKELLTVPVRTLSLGEKMKVEFIVALLHNPKILFLDEPTIGLDIISQKKIHEFIKYYNQLGNTVLFTSHYMSDIEALCKRVIILKKGGIIYNSELSKIRAELASYQLFTIKFNGELIRKESFNEWGEVINFSIADVKIKVDKRKVVEFRNYLFENYSIADITIEEAPIEDVVIQAMKGEAV